MGYTTVAFDVYATAVASARRRFLRSTVEYVIADLLTPPPSWAHGFDLVVEVHTMQVLSGPAQRTAFARTAQRDCPLAQSESWHTSKALIGVSRMRLLIIGYAKRSRQNRRWCRPRPRAVPGRGAHEPAAAG